MSDFSSDINQDYIINVMDIILVVNLILENEVAHIADLNNDFLVNVIDIIIIFRNRNRSLCHLHLVFTQPF